MVVQQILHQVCRLTLRHVLRVAVGAFQECRIRMTQQGCRHLFAGAFLQQIGCVEMPKGVQMVFLRQPALFIQLAQMPCKSIRVRHMTVWVCKNWLFSIEEIEENLILPAFRKLSRFVDCNKPFFKKLMYLAFQNAEKQCGKWHDYEMHVAPYDKDKPIYYEFTACPAAEFAVKHGLTDIMPALCNVDFASMELLHARLVRKGTCVDGCKCDYTICGDKDPYLRDHPEYRDEAGYRRNR